jgi:hypothetical protein
MLIPARSATPCAHGPGWMTRKSFRVGLICSAIRLLCAPPEKCGRSAGACLPGNRPPMLPVLRLVEEPSPGSGAPKKTLH